MSDLAKRLRHAFDGDSVPEKNICLRLAYDEIERLRDLALKWQRLTGEGAQIEQTLRIENEQLRAALRPFAELSHDGRKFRVVPMGWLRDAARALGDKE